MNITSEAIGALRADLRRVEITLGTRIESRVAATEVLLREEVCGEIRQLREEVARLRAEIARQLDQILTDAPSR